MRVFLTGATGVIGRRVVTLLLRHGHEVTALGRSREKCVALERTGAFARGVSLFDRDALRRALAAHDVVVNLATHMPASSTAMRRRRAWAENDRVRREGSANLTQVALAVGVRRFIQESFAPVYPDRGDEWIGEDVPIAPLPYNLTIADAERSALGFTGAGRTGIVLRFCGFYGSDARQTADFVQLVRRGWAPLPGRPQSYVSSISHDDAATAVLAALGLDAGIYNVGDDEPVTHREYFDSLAAALGVRAPRLPPEWMTPLFGAPGRMVARSQRVSNQKLRRASGWSPAVRSVRMAWPSIVRRLEGSRASPGAVRLQAR